jgi:hypothetical protein
MNSQEFEVLYRNIWGSKRLQSIVILYQGTLSDIQKKIQINISVSKRLSFFKFMVLCIVFLLSLSLYIHICIYICIWVLYTHTHTNTEIVTAHAKTKTYLHHFKIIVSRMPFRRRVPNCGPSNMWLRNKPQREREKFISSVSKQGKWPVN